MVSMVQMKKVGELMKAGYVQDNEISEKEWDGGFTSPSYLKNPQDNTVVKVNIDGTVEPYVSADKAGAAAKPKPRGPSFF